MKNMATYIIIIIMMFLLLSISEAQAIAKIFNVQNYGAVGDAKTDNSEAFVKAWNDACKWNGSSKVVIPKGRYIVKSALFQGPCNCWRISFILNGDLVAPLYPNLPQSYSWINFRYVNQLTLTGGGTFDGQGASAWSHNDCNKNPNCQMLPMTLGLDFITNSSIHHLRSINPKGGHFVLFACDTIKMTKLKLSAPKDSPNTDGIKIGMSNGINITSVKIGTGDDCIAMISGAKHISISDVYCGPGHGISVGSLGKNNDENDVHDIIVKNCTFNGTSNGVRIKTWASPLNKTLNANNFVYDDIVMENVYFPINIDQQYCMSGHCSTKGSSFVQINNVTYNNIRGSGNGDCGVSFKCSQGKPCQNITLKNINLWSYDNKRKLKNVCSYVHGAAYGKQNPPSCM